MSRNDQRFDCIAQKPGAGTPGQMLSYVRRGAPAPKSILLRVPTHAFRLRTKPPPANPVRLGGAGRRGRSTAHLIVDTCKTARASPFVAAFCFCAPPSSERPAGASGVCACSTRRRTMPRAGIISSRFRRSPISSSESESQVYWFCLDVAHGSRQPTSSAFSVYLVFQQTPLV